MQGGNVTYNADSDVDARGKFTRTGTLDGHQDPNLRPISDNSTVFAISRDLGTIQATTDPVVWAIGFTTDPAVNYSDLSGAPPTPRSPYYKIQYSNDPDMASIDSNCWEDYMSNIKIQIVDFLNDFSNASSRAQNLDNKTLQDAGSISYLLAPSVILAMHEVFGSTQLTIGTDEHGKLNKSDVMMFMKNTGGSKAK